MKRTAGAFMLLAALGGCTSTMSGPPWAGGPGFGGVTHNGAGRPPSIPGVVGPYGQPVAMAAPYNAAPPGEALARTMMAQSIPMELVQQLPGTPGGIVPAGFTHAAPPLGPHQGPITPVGFKAGGGGNLPYVPGAVAAAGLGGGAGGGAGGVPQAKRTEVRFAGPTGMKISWYAPNPDGRPGFSPNQLEAPARYNFVQAAIYRLKLSDIPNRPGVDLYPTLEVVPSNAKTDAFLAHSAVPVTFTDEDFEQVASGNFLVKVIYLPDPQFQDVASTGPDEVVSTRLEPGVDPIAEAHKRGSILLIVRLGNIDLEAPNTPPMDAPSPYYGKPTVPHAGMMMPGMPVPGPGAPAAVPAANGPALVPVTPTNTASSAVQQVSHQVPRSVSAARETVTPKGEVKDTAKWSRSSGK